MLEPDPIEALRRLLPPREINFHPKPELLRIVHLNQMRIMAEIPRVMAFQFNAPDFLLQLETLSFGDSQLFRTNSEGHFRGSVDFTLVRQRWFFPSLIQGGPGPVLDSLSVQQQYSRMGREFSRWMGKDHLIIVEFVNGSRQFDQQWRNGNLEKDWLQKDSVTASATHVHIQPDMIDPVLRKYVKAEYAYADAIKKTDHAIVTESLFDRSNQDAQIALQQARESVRLAAQEAAQAVEDQEKQARLDAANAAAEARERAALEAKQKLDEAKQQREQKQREEDEAKKNRDEAEIPKVELGRYANDPEGIKISLFEYIVAALKAAITTIPELEREDAYDFYKSILKRFEALRDSFQGISALDRTDGEWFGEDPEDLRRYLDSILAFLDKQNTEVDPSLGNVPWCGTSFIHNTELAISLAYFGTENL